MNVLRLSTLALLSMVCLLAVPRSQGAAAKFPAINVIGTASANAVVATNSVSLPGIQIDALTNSNSSIHIFQDGTTYSTLAWNLTDTANFDAYSYDVFIEDLALAGSPAAFLVNFSASSAFGDNLSGENQFTAGMYVLSKVGRTNALPPLYGSPIPLTDAAIIAHQRSLSGSNTTGIISVAGISGSSIPDTYGLVAIGAYNTSMGTGVIGKGLKSGGGAMGGLFETFTDFGAASTVANAALVADTWDTGYPIFLGRTNNGTTVFAVDSGGGISSAGTASATGGFKSLATDTPVSGTANGWTNTFGKAAVWYANITAGTYTIADNAGTVVRTNATVAGSTSTAIIQAGGKVIVTSGSAVSWTAVPF